jgi:uncharacterized protein (DUF2141 family)
MLSRFAGLILLVPTIAFGTQTGPELGKAEGRCRANEQGPAFLVNVDGLRDRKGLLKLEVYPSNDRDFLADDNVLIDQGKTFRRVEVPVPQSGPVQLCIRIPSAGQYSLSLLHDRNSDHRFQYGFDEDGSGFSANPRLHLAQPKAAATRVSAGNGLTPITIIMNYRRGLLSFGPLKGR